MNLYVLDGHNPVPTESFEQASRPVRVARTELSKDVFVSTVFIGIEFIMFETMIFGGKRDYECHRSRTWDEAEAIHQKIVTELTQSGAIQ